MLERVMLARRGRLSCISLAAFRGQQVIADLQNLLIFYRLIAQPAIADEPAIVLALEGPESVAVVPIALLLPLYPPLYAGPVSETRKKPARVRIREDAQDIRSIGRPELPEAESLCVLRNRQRLAIYVTASGDRIEAAKRGLAHGERLTTVIQLFELGSELFPKRVEGGSRLPAIDRHVSVGSVYVLI